MIPTNVWSRFMQVKAPNARRMRRFVVGCGLAALLVQVGCSSDEKVDTSPVGEADSGIADAADPGGDATTDATGNAADGQADGGADAEDVSEDGADGDAQSDAGLPELGPRLVLEFDATWIRTAVEQDSVTVDCYLVDDHGVRQPDPERLVIDAPAEAIDVSGADTDEHKFSFDTFGAYGFGCRAPEQGLQVDRDLIVTYPGLSLPYVRAGRAAAQLARRLRALVDAYDREDADDYTDALDRLETLPADLPDLSEADLLLDNPNGWPTAAAELEDAGAAAGPDDAAWSQGLTALTARVESQQAAFAALPDEPTADQMDALMRTNEQLGQAARHLQALDPSAIAVWEGMPRFAKLIEASVQSTRQQATTLAELLTPAVNPLAASTFYDVAAIPVITAKRMASNLNDPYVDMVKSTVMVELAQEVLGRVIDYAFPPDSNAPHIDGANGSALGLVVGRSEMVLDGSFNKEASNMRVLFIPPSGIQMATEIVNTLNDATTMLSDIRSADHILKFIYAVKNALATIRGLAELDGSLDTTLFILEPYETGADPFNQDRAKFLYFDAQEMTGSFNCGQFQQTGMMIPIDLEGGRGASADVQVAPTGC